MNSHETGPAGEIDRSTGNRKDELISFLLLTVVMAPVAAVGIVGGYGFIVWMTQLIVGPPVQ